MATTKPLKPSPDFPLFPHASGQWAKKIDGKLRYFGPWNDPTGALAKYLGKTTRQVPAARAKRKRAGDPPAVHKDFPLYAHAAGQWAKKIRGKTYYFGPWNDPAAALAKYLDEKDDLLAGRIPDTGEGLTVRELVNSFLTAKRDAVTCGELTEGSWHDYNVICKRIIKVFGLNRLVTGLKPADFQRLRSDCARTHGPVTLCNDITRARVLFKYADDTFDVRVKYGQSFDKPSKAVLRRLRQQRPPRLFTADEIRKIIAAAPSQLKAMIYLGINCGFGNNDCAMLTMDALKLGQGWAEFGRPKTGVPRRCPLWPETVKAIRQALIPRPKVKDPAHQNRVFITTKGTTWEPKAVKDNPIANEMAKLLKSLKLYKRSRGFYALRHTFQTVGEKSRDKDAVRAIMGHVEAAYDMSAVYNEEAVEDYRLKAVTDFVRDWLLKKERKAA